MILDQVPVLSMKHGATTAFADDLGQTFERFGFAMICDHGLDPALVERGWSLAKALFAQPEEVMHAYHVPGGGGQGGYAPLGTEITRDTAANDLKEIWNIGRSSESSHGRKEGGSRG